MPDDTPAESITRQLQSALSGRYQIGRLLGEGGMAVVFEATDLKHLRPVAVKILRPELSAVLGADRFLREIQVTAGLQHPHILPLYDSGVAGSLLYYVMPLMQGESLRNRLDRERQLPVLDAVALTRTVASALDYAHRQGVLHRDIKPENILLHDGQPMLADFGIALAVRSAGTERLTRTGLSIGTPAYMSPEQLGGDRALDARSDLYSLACVTYEMMAGAAPFSGPNMQAVVAAVMTGELKPLTAVRRTVPELVARAVERALEPLPADRFATVADFSQALGADLTSQPIPTSRRRGTRRAPWSLIGGVGLAALAAGGLLGHRSARLPPDPVRHLSIDLPPGASVAVALAGPASGPQTAIALAPDGTHLVYVTSRNGTTVLASRPFDADSITVLAGTDGAYHPFFSPDGASIAFFADGMLKRMPLSGGDPVVLAPVNRVTGAVWPTAERIAVLEGEGFELHWISAAGGETDSVLHLISQFVSPHLLPGSEWVAGQFSPGQMGMLSLRTGQELAITARGVLAMDSVRQSDLLFGTSPHWIEPGYLLYGAGDGELMAMPFDGAARRVLGGAVPVLQGMRMEAGMGYAEFDISQDGMLAYVPGDNRLYSHIGLVNTDGRIDTLPLSRGAYTQLRASPDGTRLAVQERSQLGGWSVLLVDIGSGVRQTVRVPGNFRAFPAAWVPGSNELMIGLWDPVLSQVYGARLLSLDSGTWTDVHLPVGASYLSLSPDGRQLVFNDWRSSDLFLRPLRGDTTRTSIPARGFASSFSHDGRWVAWSSVDGSISVSPVPPTGAIFQAANRGHMPVWTPDGTSLIYRDGDAYFKVPISTASGFRAGRPQLLVRGPFLSTFAWNHDITPDGRLLVMINSPEREVRSLGLITGLPALVERAARR
jgi:serine/threonine-protein kinase